MTIEKLPRCYSTALAILACPAALMAQSDKTSSPSDQKTIDDEVYIMSPFEVNNDSNYGYSATQSMAGTRINTKLEDIGSAITVVTSTFLKDTGATNNQTLLTYTTNTEVGGPLGNTANYSGGGVEQEGYRLTSPNSNTRVRGLTSADNTRNFFTSNVPWDSYNVDRIEVQRGPNSILFGLGSPAGIINATTKSAEHVNKGQIEMRYGSYNTKRASIDVNRDIIEDELAVRVNVLHNDEKYQQKPAYSQDDRVYGAIRYDPKFLKFDGASTTIKMNYENGNIKSNNPRTITPLDRITPWWDSMNQATYDTQYVQYSGYFYGTSTNPNDPTDQDSTRYFKDDVGAVNKSRPDGSANPSYQPYIENPGMYGGVWLRYNNGESTPYSASQPESKTVGGISNTGTIDNTIGGIPYVRRVAIDTTTLWAQRSSAKYYAYGLWKSKTLTDSSLFDFYNNLIDGDTKKEWQDFHTFNTSIAQQFLNGQAGFEAAYDVQEYHSGNFMMTADGAINVDINQTNLDGTTNANLGKAYVEGSGSGGDTATYRDAARMTAFVTHDFTQGPDNIIMKILGRHTITGLLSQDRVQSDSRSYLRYGTPDWFGSLVSTGTGATNLDSNDRAVTSTYYISDSLLGKSSYHGLNLSRPSGQDVPSSVSYYWFNPKWNATNVDPSAYWTNPYNGRVMYQSDNPANYVGWSTMDVPILNAENGDSKALTTGATLSRREVQSYAAVWQGFFWDESIVGMYGIRHDRVKSWAVSGYYGSNTGRVDWTHKDSDGNYTYSLDGKTATVNEAYSPSWSVVVKLNKLFGDHLPIEINPFYNRSQNFQITGTRNDMYGNALAVPSGSTKEYGVTLSDKAGRVSLRINHYETTVLNATNSVGFATWFFFGGSSNFIARNEDRADAYEYHLGRLGDASSANIDPTTSSWNWRYTPRSGQTQTDADAEMQAGVDAWRAYTKEPIVQKVLKAWGYNDFNVTQTTTASTPVTNFVATEDQISKGWEGELTANITRNWRVSFNASKTTAIRSNIGGSELDAFVKLTNEYEHGAMGTIRQWGGGGITSTSLSSWNSNFYSGYALMKQMEGNEATDLRKWRFNLATNYDFDFGWLKGVNVGGGYRWQDKVVIGYPPIINSDNTLSFDLDNPYYGSTQTGVDLWIGYTRKLSDKITWNVQLNVRNVGKGDKIYPVSTEWDGSAAQWAIAPSETWTLTSTFDF
jgi:hypothetical protein